MFAGRSTSIVTSPRPALDPISRWGDVAALGELASEALSGSLDRGVCHNDLTLDNVHIDNDRLTIFDLDSAGETWRAWESQGVYHFSALTGGPWWESWLAGYEAVRSMPERDRAPVPSRHMG
jgi:Ser/Thr protein kinase RdoA (MazF antagonist)